MAAGRKLLRSGHERGPPGVDDVSVIIVFTACGDEASCREAARVARSARRSSILVVVVSPDNRADVRLLRDIATSPRYIFVGRDEYGALLPIFDRIKTEPEHLYYVGLRRATLTYPIPTWGDYTVSSVQGIGRSGQVIGIGYYDPESRVLTWQTDSFPGGGVTVTFRIAALVPGLHAAGAGAAWQVEDSRGAAYDPRVAPRSVMARWGGGRRQHGPPAQVVCCGPTGTRGGPCDPAVQSQRRYHDHLRSDDPCPPLDDGGGRSSRSTSCVGESSHVA